MHAVWRGTTRVCAELLLHTADIPWRGDPWALTIWKLCDFFGSLLRTGYLDDATLAQHWDLAGTKGHGPLAALRKSLHLIGVTGPLECWVHGSVGDVQVRLMQPLRAAPCTLRNWLLQALLARDLGHLGKRRPGIDWTRAATCIGDSASLRVSLGLTATQACALRSVQAGDCFTQRQAKHWSGRPLDVGTCPFCSEGTEDEIHRWAVCPSWSTARRKALGSTDAVALWHRLPKATATLGLPTLPIVVSTWRKTLPPASSLAQPTPFPAPSQVWLDGSGLYPKDKHLRVTAWAVAWKTGTWHSFSGWTVPPHTVPRAELSALCVVLSWSVDTLDICTDCQLVSKGFGQLARAGRVPRQLLQSPLGDLWMLAHTLLKGRSGITVRWMPAHLTLEQLLCRGLHVDDFSGNELADRAAKARAMLIAPTPEVVASRTCHAADEKLAMRTIGMVQEAMLATRTRIAGTDAALKTRKRKVPNRLFKQHKKRRAASPTPNSVVADILHLAWHKSRSALSGAQRSAHLWQIPPVAEAGVHRIVVPHGPAIRQGSVVKPRNGALNLTAFCTKCGRKATNTGRWIALGRTSCADAPFRGVWVQHFHEFPDGPPLGRECVACGLMVTSAARAAASRRLCPVWHFEVNGVSDPLATAWGRRVQALAGLWCDHAFPECVPPAPETQLGPRDSDSLPEERQPGAQPVELALGPPAAQAPLFLAPWRGHWKLSCSAISFCLRCGTFPRDRRHTRRWDEEPCIAFPEPADYRGRALCVLRSGAVDVQLLAAPPAWRQRAGLLGWRAASGQHLSGQPVQSNLARARVLRMLSSQQGLVD